SGSSARIYLDRTSANSTSLRGRGERPGSFEAGATTLKCRLKATPISQALSFPPELRAAHSPEPHLKLRTVPLQWLWQWPARILAQRVRHAFPEPVGLEEPRAETAKVLVLQMMNELMPDKVPLPSPIAHNNADSRDGICIR